MTKREIKIILNQYNKGVSKDYCRTAIIQMCCPEVSRENVNKLCDALEYFESAALSIDGITPETMGE